MIEVVVSRLGLDSSTNSFVVVLQERGGTRLLPIWIGQPEADSIVMHMHDVKRPRPITHDLASKMIGALGAQLRRVDITHVEKRTYYAEMQLQHGDALVRLDARPSDAIAIALRLDAPIFASDELLIEPETEEQDAEAESEIGSSEFTLPAEGGTSEEELSTEQLKAYLEKLRPEDFGKFKP